MLKNAGSRSFGRAGSAMALLAAMWCASVAFAGGEPEWHNVTTAGPSGGTRVGNQYVRALLKWDHDGNAGTPDVLAVGGDFNHASGGNETAGFVVWNGSTLTMIGTGFYDGSNPGFVRAFAIDTSDNSLIVGGAFTSVGIAGTPYSAGNIGKLKWNSGSGTWSWTSLGTLGQQVNAVAYYNGHIYAGLEAGNTSCLVRYNSGNDSWDPITGSNWQMSTGTVRALRVGYPAGTTEETDPFPDPILMVGGTFVLDHWVESENGPIIGRSVDAAAYWSETANDFIAGSTTEGFGGGVVKTVNAFMDFDTTIAVGGLYADVLQNDNNDSCLATTKITVCNLAKRTGSGWGQYSAAKSRWSGVQGEVNALTVFQGSLVMAGGFSQAAIHSDPMYYATDNERCYDASLYWLAQFSGINNIGYYNNALGSGVYGGFGDGLPEVVYAVEVYNGELYAGGKFHGSGLMEHGFVRWTAAEDVCELADVGSQGGVDSPDGVLDNNDFIVFITLFFNHDSRADLGSTGGVPGADSAWDNNDLIVFIQYFFSGCEN